MGSDASVLQESLLYLPAVVMGVFQLLYTTYLIPMIASPKLSLIKRTYSLKLCSLARSVAIVIPAYREGFSSLVRTANSVINQDYPRELMRVLIVVEDGDEGTLVASEAIVKYLLSRGVKAEVVITKCCRRYGKACALNEALKYVNEDVFLVFDADDEVPRDYVSSVVNQLCGGAVAVTTKVYREGRRLGAKFLTLDTLIWYDVALPTLLRLGGYVPLSGEGLAVRTDYLRSVGGFPMSLAEDAYLALLIARDGEVVSYLSNTYIVEKAPKTFISQVRQKIRWVQGFYECLVALTKMLLKRELSIRRVGSLLLPYFSPVTSIATVVTHTLFIIYWLAFLLGATSVMSIYDILFPAPIFYWGLFNMVVGNTYLIYLTLYLVSDTRFSKLAPYALLMPAYWYLVGFVTIVATLAPREWRKTER